MAAVLKKGLLYILLILIAMILFNLSTLNLPADKTLYNETRAYFSQTQKQFGLPEYTQNDIGMGMTGYKNTITLLSDTQPAYNTIISAIENAEKNINIELFIIRNDRTGRHFKNVLINKARQGVEVRFIYDAWGSALTSRAYFKELRQNGVKLNAYNPLLASFWQGRLFNRLHRKMVIVDGRRAFIGGENIGNEYLGKNKKIGFWKDTGIIFEGDAVLSIQQVFFNDWLSSSGEKVTNADYYPQNRIAANNIVEIIPGGPDSPQTNMNMPYIRLINQANKIICIVNPYLFPDRALLESLYQASDRNIDVYLVVPAKSDLIISDIINAYYTNQLKKHGIRVFYYNNGFIHSKYLIIDNRIATIGTANLDRLSFFRNYEINSVFYNREIIDQLQSDFWLNIKNSHEKQAVSDRSGIKAF